MLAQLDRTGEDQISLTHSDSRAMAAHTTVGVGYNVQVAVDAKNKLIVEQAVTNQVLDMRLLTETSEPAREILGVETIDVVADCGYFKIEDIEACERAVPHAAKPQRGSSVREGLFRKDEFRYDAGLDAYVCRAGKLLTPICCGGCASSKGPITATRKPAALASCARGVGAHERRPDRRPVRRMRPSRRPVGVQRVATSTAAIDLYQ